MKHRGTCFYPDGKERLGGNYHLVVICTDHCFGLSDTSGSSFGFISRCNNQNGDGGVDFRNNHQKKTAHKLLAEWRVPLKLK